MSGTKYMKHLSYLGWNLTNLIIIFLTIRIYLYYSASIWVQFNCFSQSSFFFHWDLYRSLTTVDAITAETPLLKCKYLLKVNRARTVHKRKLICISDSTDAFL